VESAHWESEYRWVRAYLYSSTRLQSGYTVKVAIALPQIFTSLKDGSDFGARVRIWDNFHVQRKRSGKAYGGPRLFEDDAHSVVDIRTDSLQSLRELGPPDLVHLIKQPVKSSSKQVCIYSMAGSSNGTKRPTADIRIQRQEYTTMSAESMLPHPPVSPPTSTLLPIRPRISRTSSYLGCTGELDRRYICGISDQETQLL
jgi:hypothetical protein